MSTFHQGVLRVHPQSTLALVTQSTGRYVNVAVDHSLGVLSVDAIVPLGVVRANMLVRVHATSPQDLTSLDVLLGVDDLL